MLLFFRTIFKTRGEAIAFGAFLLLLLVILPLAIPVFRLNLVGKYLSFGFVAIGLVLLWGRCGILSLGQGVFFGLGGYCMAMFLKLEASDPITTAIQSTPGIPDFMDWNQITKLPLYWEPFKSLPFTIAAIFILPSVIAFIIGWARRRCLLRHHYAGDCTDFFPRDRRQPRLHRGQKRHHRPTHALRLGHPQ